MIVVGFFGSRKGCNPKTIEKIFQKLMKRFEDNLQVIVGDCIGVDEQIYKYCKENQIPVRVIAVRNNWSKISYIPNSDDILERVGTLDEPLHIRLAKRTRKLVEYVKSQNGFLIGINTDGKGSQLAIRIAKQLKVKVYTFTDSQNSKM